MDKNNFKLPQNDKVMMNVVNKKDRLIYVRTYTVTQLNVTRSDKTSLIAINVLS